MDAIGDFDNDGLDDFIVCGTTSLMSRCYIIYGQSEQWWSYHSPSKRNYIDFTAAGSDYNADDHYNIIVNTVEDSSLPFIIRIIRIKNPSNNEWV